MPPNEVTLESFVANNSSILDELIGTDATELKNLLSNGAISGMQKSQILNQVTAASSASMQKTLLNTRLNTFSRVATNTMMKDAPEDTKYVYIGPVDEKTRDECLEYASAGALTEAQIMENGWEASLVDGGGFNCRHKWEIASEEGKKLFEGKKAQNVIDGKTTPDITSLSNAGKFTNKGDAVKFMEANGVVSIGRISKASLDTLNTITIAIKNMPSSSRRNLVVTDFSEFQKITGKKFTKRQNRNYGVSQTVDAVDYYMSRKDIPFSVKKELIANSKGTFNVVGFNTRRYKSFDDLLDRKRTMNSNWKKQTGNDYYLNLYKGSTAEHEFGHIVHHSLSSNKIQQFEILAKDWIENSGSNIDYIKKKTGWTELHGEAFAEAWACYTKGNKSLLPDNIIKFMDEIK